MDETTILPMFPLGSVLLPGAPLPLHVFEPRYQVLLNDVLAGDRSFGVVLISHGHEVGGGDQRMSIGTRAHVLDHRRFDDGRAEVVCRGGGRLEIVEWLADDPYPRAVIRDLPADETPARSDVERVVATFRRLLQAAVDLGRLASVPSIEIPDDAAEAMWQLASAAPIGPLDTQAVLEADTSRARLDRLDGALAELADQLELERRLS